MSDQIIIKTPETCESGEILSPIDPASPIDIINHVINPDTEEMHQEKLRGDSGIMVDENTQDHEDAYVKQCSDLVEYGPKNINQKDNCDYELLMNESSVETTASTKLENEDECQEKNVKNGTISTHAHSYNSNFKSIKSLKALSNLIDNNSITNLPYHNTSDEELHLDNSHRPKTLAQVKQLLSFKILSKKKPVLEGIVCLEWNLVGRHACASKSCELRNRHKCIFCKGDHPCIECHCRKYFNNICMQYNSINGCHEKEKCGKVHACFCCKGRVQNYVKNAMS